MDLLHFLPEAFNLTSITGIALISVSARLSLIPTHLSPILFSSIPLSTSSSSNSSQFMSTTKLTNTPHPTDHPPPNIPHPPNHLQPPHPPPLPLPRPFVASLLPPSLPLPPNHRPTPLLRPFLSSEIRPRSPYLAQPTFFQRRPAAGMEGHLRPQDGRWKGRVCEAERILQNEKYTAEFVE